MQRHAKGWIRLTWSEDMEPGKCYVMVVPVDTTLRLAVKEAGERLVELMADDHAILLCSTRVAEEG